MRVKNVTVKQAWMINRLRDELGIHNSFDCRYMSRAQASQEIDKLQKRVLVRKLALREGKIR